MFTSNKGNSQQGPEGLHLPESGITVAAPDGCFRLTTYRRGPTRYRLQPGQWPKDEFVVLSGWSPIRSISSEAVGGGQVQVSTPEAEPYSSAAKAPGNTV